MTGPHQARIETVVDAAAAVDVPIGRSAGTYEGPQNVPGTSGTSENSDGFRLLFVEARERLFGLFEFRFQLCDPCLLLLPCCLDDFVDRGREIIVELLRGP